MQVSTGVKIPQSDVMTMLSDTLFVLFWSVVKESF